MKKFLMACVLVLALAGCGPKEGPAGKAPTRVQVEPVSLTTTVAQERYSASVEPNVRVALAFNSGGYVTSIKTVAGEEGSRPVQAGDPVRRGEVLVRLRQGDFQSRLDAAAAQVAKARAGTEGSAAQIREAEGAHQQAAGAVVEAQAAEAQAVGAVRELEAGRLQAEAALREAEAGSRQASADYDRARALSEAEAMTRADYDAARARYEMARAKVDQAREQVSGLQAKLVQGRAQVSAARARVQEARGQERSAAARVEGARAAFAAGEADVSTAQASQVQAALALEDSALRSPLDGVVLSRSVEVGSLVAPGAAGMEVADMSVVKAVFGVPDLVMERLQPGQKVAIGVQSLPGRSFDGRISSISPAADPQSRTFTVEISVPNAKGELKIGMVAALDLTEGREAGPTDVLTVPVSAIQKEGAGGTYVVFIEDGGVARRREVKLGEAIGNRVVVLEGLKDRDRVITSGANLLHDGDPVMAVQ